ncbi:MAG: hypothetical protein JW828_00955 [Sedimentisphaerales bacterium]|nr:hypothetical protein [Sedimentisphaerales bacterium]
MRVFAKIIILLLACQISCAGPIYLIDAFKVENGWQVHWRYDPRVTDCAAVRILDAEGRTIGQAAPPTDLCLLKETLSGKTIQIVAVTKGGQSFASYKLTLTEPVGRPQAISGRIAVRKDKKDRAEFFNTCTQEPFIVKGFNYIRLRSGDHSTFDAATKTTAADYDPLDAEAMFRLLARYGYNTVRVFIIGRSGGNPGIGGDYDTTVGLYEPYMQNVIDFLRRARANGIYVLPTFGDGELPRNRSWRDRLEGLPRGPNTLYLTQQGIEVKVAYVSQFLERIQREEPSLLEAMLGIQCQNELHLDCRSWPFTVTSDHIVAANGISYDMGSLDDRQRLMDEGLNHYHARIAEAVKRIDTGLLVSEGIFVLRAVGKSVASHKGIPANTRGDPRFPPTALVLGRSPLDFIDIHFYHTRRDEVLADAFRRDMDSVGFFDPSMQVVLQNTPVILGEFGSFQFVDPTFERAKEKLIGIRNLARQAPLSGWMMWTFDCFEQPRLWHAMESGPEFPARLAQSP